MDPFTHTRVPNALADEDGFAVPAELAILVASSSVGDAVDRHLAHVQGLVDKHRARVRDLDSAMIAGWWSRSPTGLGRCT